MPMDYAELIVKINQQANELVKATLITRNTTYKELTYFFEKYVTNQPTSTFFLDKFSDACYTYLQIYNK